MTTPTIQTPAAGAGAAADAPLLRITNLGVAFPSASGPIHAVREVTLSVGRGEVVALVGESGSGKSVTAMTLLGLTRGRGRHHHRRGDVRRHRPRRRRGRGAAAHPRQADRDGVPGPDELAQPGAEDRRAGRGTDHRPRARLQGRGPQARDRRAQRGRDSARGGAHRQLPARVLRRHAPARDDRDGALVQPELLIADEPTTALDVTVQAQILDLILRLREDRGMSVLLVTHDLGVVAETADSVAVMYGGRIVEQAARRPALRRPAPPLHLGLIGSIPPLTGERPDRLPTIAGTPPSPRALPAGCSFGLAAPMPSSSAPTCRACGGHRGALGSVLAADRPQARAACRS